ncbi:hypothetical protein EYF80_032857 [Liparis tanakae]|uniref:Uncharacterized protein n=1 Tax=Liparis tanakae TaxID=230148 RepID=A0A4Z2GTE3_9TELE|nr:hypothetical protein EYF80_032857 [Liparis tanakae]
MSKGPITCSSESSAAVSGPSSGLPPSSASSSGASVSEYAMSKERPRPRRTEMMFAHIKPVRSASRAVYAAGAGVHDDTINPRWRRRGETPIK